MLRPKIKRRERDTIIQALRAGVVPKLGLQHIPDCCINSRLRTSSGGAQY